MEQIGPLVVAAATVVPEGANRSVGYVMAIENLEKWQEFKANMSGMVKGVLIGGGAVLVLFAFVMGFVADRRVLKVVIADRGKERNV